MPDFRTKGRGKDRQVFPISGGTEHRIKDDYEQDNPPEAETLGQKIQEESPPEEEVLEEKIEEEQKKQKKHKLAKPSFSTKHVVRHDIKDMMRKEDSQEHGSKDYVNYKRKLDREADRTYSKENKKAKKRRKKETKKEEKQEQRQDTDMREQST